MSRLGAARRPAAVARTTLRTAAVVVAAGFAGAAVGTAPAQAATPTPIAYRLDLRWDETTSVLAGTTRVRLVNSSSRPLERVWFRLWPNAWRPVGSRGRAAGCAVPRMTTSVLAGGRAGRRTVDCSALE